MNEVIDTLLTHSPALIIGIPLLGAFLTPILSKINEKVRNIFVIAVLGITEFIVLLLAYDIFTNNIVHTYVFGAKNPILTLPSGYAVPVRIIFEIDGIGIFMGIIAITLAFVASIYSWSFMKENTGLDKYYTLLLLLAAGMLGMVSTGDMFNFFVFLEITSIASCALIAFRVNRGESQEAAFKYIIISSIGALFVLFAVALLYGQYDALNIATLANKIQYTLLDKVALVLFISALGMKAGIVPMHMWLPDAYGEAPASVTLAIIAATQASLYALVRMCFTLYGGIVNITVIGWIIGWILIILAIASMFIGVTMALLQSDFKRLIAYAAIAEIGYMILGIGAGLALLFNNSAYSIKALHGGVFHIINDAIDAGLLFLVAGAVFYATKERVLDRLGGLARNMKYTTIFFIIGALAVAGMPPMNGFASKLLIYESTYQVSPILAVIAILTSILLLAVMVKVFHSAFMGPPLTKAKGEVPKSMIIAMAILAALIVLFGLFSNLVIESMVKPATNALLNQATYIGQILGGV
jgi:multicomponent Na+:H+ antiporter subunit D